MLRGWSWLSGGGSSSPAFGIIQPPAGTSPTASTGSDTLTFTSSNASITITGNSATKTIDFIVASSASFATNRAIVSDGTGALSASATTSTEIGYLSGVTSAIQTQLDGKEPTITAGTTAQYWRGDKTFQTLNTSAVPEGSNLYYTDARARAAISVTSPLQYNSGTGALSILDASAVQSGVVNTTTQTFAGTKTFSSAPIFSSLTQGSVLFLGTSSVVAQDNSNFFWNDSLNHLGLGSNVPVATLDSASTVAWTNTEPSSGSATATLETLAGTPAAPTITVVSWSDTPTISGITQNLGVGAYTCNGQTIDYEVYSYKDYNSVRYYSQLGTGSFTDTINDGITTFNLTVQWSISAGSADGYLVYSSGNTQVNDMGAALTAVDDASGWDIGTPFFGSPDPQGYLSSGGTISVRNRSVATSPSGGTYYTSAATTNEPEPASGLFYIYDLDYIKPGDATLIQVEGSDDNLTYDYFIQENATGQQTLYANWWNSFGSISPPTTPTTYGYTSTGQTYAYRIYTYALIKGYFQLNSASFQQVSATLTNDGQRRYIALSWSGASTTVPSDTSTVFAYKILRSTNGTGGPYSQFQILSTASTLGSVATTLNDDALSTWSSSPSTTPTSFIPAAGHFENANSNSSWPTATSGFDLPLTVRSTGSNSLAGVGFYSSLQARMGSVYGTVSNLTLSHNAEVRARTDTGTIFATFNATQISFSATTQSIPCIFWGNTTTNHLLYISQSALTVSVGSSISAQGAMLGVTTNTTSKVSFAIANPSNHTANSIYISRAGGQVFAVSAYGQITGCPGQSLVSAFVPMRVTTSVSAASNTSTTETSLILRSLTANSAISNGDMCVIKAFGTFAATANNKQIRLRFTSTSGTIIIDTGSLAVTTAMTWCLTAQILRSSSTAGKLNWIFTYDTNLMTGSNNALSITWGNTNSFVLTGQGGASNDITAEAMYINYEAGA